MSDNINIDWGNQQLPDTANAFTKGWGAGHQMMLAKQEDAARQNALAAPSDPNALGAYGAFNPMGAQAMQSAQTFGNSQQDFAREAQARQAASTYAGAPTQQNGAALAGLDPQTFSQVTQSIGAMDVNQRAKVNDSMGFLGSAAQQLLGMPQAGRAQALAAMAPALAQHGITQQQIQQYTQSGLSDQQLQGFIGQAVGVTGMIDQHNKQIEQQQTQQQIGLRGRELDQTSKFQNYQMQKGEAVPFGTPVINPVTGQVIYNGDPQSSHGDTFSRMIGAESGGNQLTASGQPVTSGKGAIGIAQVMPSTGPEAAAAAGVPWDAAKYRTDATYNATIGRAYFQKLQGQFGGDEVKAVAAYNAGAGRVNQAVTQGGANWQEFLPKETQGYIQKVMSNPGGGTSPFEGTAQAIARGDAPLLTGRAAVTGTGAQTMRRAYEINPNLDGKTYGPEKATIQSFTSGSDSKTVQAINNVTQHIGALRALGAAMKNGNVPAFNAAANWWAQQTGEPAPTNMKAAQQILGGEIVKAVAGVGGGEGERAKAEKIASGDASNDQINGGLDVVQGLVNSQLHTLKQKYEAGSGKHDFEKFLTPMVRQGFNMQPQQGNGSGVLASGHAPSVSNW